MDQASKLRQVLNLLWVDRYGYPFDDWVADRVERGASYRQVERELDDLVGIGLSHVTLLKWYSKDAA